MPTYTRVDASSIEERRVINVDDYMVEMRQIADERIDAIVKYEDISRQLEILKARVVELNSSFIAKVAALRGAQYPDPSWLPRYTDEYPDPSWLTR